MVGLPRSPIELGEILSSEYMKQGLEDLPIIRYAKFLSLFCKGGNYIIGYVRITSLLLLAALHAGKGCTMVSRLKKAMSAGVTLKLRLYSMHSHH